MHPNLIHHHPSSHSHQSHQLIPPIHHLTASAALPNNLKRTKLQQQEDDEETLVKKKKNADAQAAFRLRRQTYIKSLEDTVTELQDAVREMELLVKAANHEVKIKCEQVAYLETKLEQTKLKPTRDETSDDSNEHDNLNKSNLQHCHCCRFAPSPSSAFDHNDQKMVISNNHNLGNHSNTSVLDKSTPDTSQDHPQPSHWSNPSSMSHHRPVYPALVLSNQQQHPTSNGRQSPKSDYNRMVHRHQTNEHESVPPNTASSASFGVFFDPHYGPPNPTASNAATYYSPIDSTHHHQNHHHSPTATAAPPLENSLQSMISCSPNLPPLTSSSYERSSPTTPGHLPGHLTSNHITVHHPTPRSWSATYTSSPKLFSPVHDRYLNPPHTNTHSNSSGYTLVDDQKRKREDESLGMASHSSSSSGLNHNPKLNGLPAKVARCEQTVMEVSRVVSQAKEQAKMAVAGSSTAHGIMEQQREQQRIRKSKFEQQQHQQAFGTNLV